MDGMRWYYLDTSQSHVGIKGPRHSANSVLQKRQLVAEASIVGGDHTHHLIGHTTTHMSSESPGRFPRSKTKLTDNTYTNTHILRYTYHIGVSIDELGNGVHHNVRAEVQRVLQGRRHEGVVDHKDGLMLVCDLSRFGNVGDLQGGVGRSLQPHNLLGVGTTT